MDIAKEKIKNFKKLMHEIKSGKKNALETFYNIYGKIIKITAFHFCKKPDLVDEVVNDVLIKVWKSACKLNNFKNPEGLVYTITANAAKSKLSRQTNYLPLDDIKEVAAAAADDTAEYDFYERIKDLNETERQIIIMKILCDCTFEVIAEETGKPLSSVSSTYYRALEKLKK